jgi:hypothetical protein
MLPPEQPLHACRLAPPLSVPLSASKLWLKTLVKEKQIRAVVRIADSVALRDLLEFFIKGSFNNDVLKIKA